LPKVAARPPGLSASPSLAGIQKVTGATSRYIACAIAGWFVLLACVPKVGAVLLALPLPIIGAALVFNGASMLVGGIQIVMSRPMTMPIRSSSASHCCLP
jgi:xanthine permease XanP